MTGMQKHIELQVFGRVQMVMFRDFIKRAARAWGVVGTVRNNPDGSVSVVAEGKEEALRKLVARAHRGSILSRVDRVEEKWSDLPAENEGALGEYKTFVILY